MPPYRPLRVKFILPALTEATSPYWRPIKYSLFPPLGLATLAAFLAPDDEAVIVDEHVQPLDLRRPARSRRDPGLHHQRAIAPIGIADHYRARGAFVALGGLHVTSLPDEAARARRRDLSRARRSRRFRSFSTDFRAGRPRSALSSRRRAARWTACRRSGAI